MTNHHITISSELQMHIVTYLEKEKNFKLASNDYQLSEYSAQVGLRGTLLSKAIELLEERDDYGRRAAVELLITTEEFINAVNYYTGDIMPHLKTGEKTHD